MAERVFDPFFDPRSVRTIQVFPSSRIHKELTNGIGKARTLSKNSMPSTTLKSSISTMEKLISPAHSPIRI
ncbi:hypothetical protein HanIR_Chr09g0430731 [Helianthus annuus]|nr:hypothetical protein HanIR_Chr09g0430731 [Helianthus annuus]